MGGMFLTIIVLWNIPIDTEIPHFQTVNQSRFFGLIIGLVGCYKGIYSGRDSVSLGKAVTSAVVVSVTLIIIADAMFETTFNILELR